MSYRLTYAYPLSDAVFARQFPNDDACAKYLFHKRWPDGFVCPSCGGRKCCALAAKRHTWECASCKRQTSVTAGTVMHRSKVGLALWFRAAHLVSTQPDGISAARLRAELGLGSYKTAWLMLQKLRRAMVESDGAPLRDIVEIDAMEIPYRSKSVPSRRPRTRRTGKLLVIGALELAKNGHARRVRLAPLRDISATSIARFIARVVAHNATIVSDRLPGCHGVARRRRTARRACGASHGVPRRLRTVFSSFKRWALGTYHGVRKKHLHRYLDEFAFRWNRRRQRRTSFDALLGLTARLGHASYRNLIAARA